MFEAMRKVFGPVAVGVIIGAIALVFVFYGVYNPRTRSGYGSGAAAATVNGETIGVGEFEREYQQRVEYFQGLMKGQTDPNILKQLGIRRQVLEELINRKLILQEAQNMGLVASDEEVRARIEEMPYFREKKDGKEGKFDPVLYKRVLEANNRRPGDFEDLIRQDILRGLVMQHMRSLIKVSEKEVEQEFQASEDRRQLDFVLLDRDFARKRMSVSDKEIDEFLKTPENVNATKAYYDQHKYDYRKTVAAKPAAVTKDKKPAPPKVEFYGFDEVKRKVAADLLKDRRSDEIARINHDLAQEVIKKAKSPDFKSFLKSKGLEAKTSEKFNRLQGSIAGVGEVPELLADAFKDSSPLLKEPKVYESGANYVVAFDLKTFKPKSEDFSKVHDTLVKNIENRKQQQLQSQWMTELRSHAKISMNQAIESESSESGETAED